MSISANRSRPTYRAFYDADKGIRFHDINLDGTPGPEVAGIVHIQICNFIADELCDGKGWLVDFFTALGANGKANLRGQ